MEKIVQKCPCCGSWVNGEKVKSYTNKVTRQGVKTGVHTLTSAGGTATGAAVGTAILPGIGTLVGGALGFLGSAMFNQKVNETLDKGIDMVEDNLMDMDYKFVCPNPSCGHEWTKNVNDLESVSSKITYNSASSVNGSNVIDKQRIYRFLAENGYTYATVLSIEHSGVKLKVSSPTRMGEDYINGMADGSFFEGQMFMA